MALFKITKEFQHFYDDLGMNFRFMEQKPPYGPYKIQPTDKRDYRFDELPHLVLHRVGTHGWHEQWTRFINMGVKDRKLTKYRTTYFLDDFLCYMGGYQSVEIMRRCNNVITLGYQLKPYLEETHAMHNVVQLKTHISPHAFDIIEDVAFMDSDKLNLVWFSMARTGLGFMEELIAAINGMSEFKDIRFWCVTPQAARVRASLFQYRDADVRFLESVPFPVLCGMEKKADILINPISMETDNWEFVNAGEDRTFFMNCKSEVKLAHSGGAETPLLTGRSLPYEKTVIHGKNGFISSDVDEWIEIILKLKDDEELRKTVGKNARELIEAEYLSEDRFKQYMDIILSEVE